MSAYLGDFALGSTFDLKFTTVNTSGTPTTLGGTPVVSAYPDNSTTELTAGITLTTDFDSRTGMHNVRVVASSGNGYASGSNYQLVITTGTVGSTSVVGYVIGQFSIEARSGLRPTTAGRTLDVSAGGEAGVDWANVGGQTTAVALGNTTIGNVTGVPKVDVDTIKTNPVVNAGTVTFPTGATLASTTNITAGNITNVNGNVTGTVATLTTYTGNTPQTGDAYARIGAAGAGLTALGDTRLANLDASISSRLSSAGYTAPDNAGISFIATLTNATLDATVSSRSTFSGGAVASVTAAVEVGSYSAGQDPATLVLDTAMSGHTTSGSVGEAINNAGSSGSDPWSTAIPGAYASGTAGYILGNGFTDVLAVLGTPAGASMSADIAAIKTDTSALSDLSTTAQIVTNMSNQILALRSRLGA